jgi:hypothetical protein
MTPCMKRYRLVEVGCSHEVYLVAADSTDARDDRTVATFTVVGAEPAWMSRPMQAFVAGGSCPRRAVRASSVHFHE